MTYTKDKKNFNNYHLNWHFNMSKANFYLMTTAICELKIL